jgi:hypothetical protein
MRICIVLLVVVGCDSGAKEPVVSKPDEVKPRAPIADALGIQPVLMDGPVVAPTAPPETVGWLDSPAWPATGDVEIAWLVGTVLVPRKSNPDVLESPLAVAVTVGGVSRVAFLKQQFGDLKARHQSACGHALLKSEVASITFAEAGQGGYVVRRKASDVLELVSWDQEDGACDDHGRVVACPRHEVARVRMHVPAKAKVHEAIFTTDGDGKRTPFTCAD